jgi:hypothetical protein
MKGIPFLALIAFFLVSCQTMPVIKSSSGAAPEKQLTCPSPFLKEQYRLIHAIEARAGGETQGAIIGITVADPATRSVSCAIMTVEGMVLFAAEANATLKVIRALPPFDSGDFAKNMIEDIKLIFFAPEGKFQAGGTLTDGATVCRYREENGYWQDVIAGPTEGVEIKKYSPRGSLKRAIKLSRTADNAYRHIELMARETFNYSLIMTLIEAEPIEGELKAEKTKGSDE